MSQKYCDVKIPEPKNEMLSCRSTPPPHVVWGNTAPHASDLSFLYFSCMDLTER